MKEMKPEEMCCEEQGIYHEAVRVLMRVVEDTHARVEHLARIMNQLPEMAKALVELNSRLSQLENNKPGIVEEK